MRPAGFSAVTERCRAAAAAPLEVALLRDARGAAGGGSVRGSRGLDVAGQVVQMCAHRLEPVVVGDARVVVELAQQLESRLRAADRTARSREGPSRRAGLDIESP
jgi:hypothetical protein